jgi:hypothetical protein
MVGGSMYYPFITMLYDTKVGVLVFETIEGGDESIDQGMVDDFSLVIGLGTKGGKISLLEAHKFRLSEMINKGRPKEV